MHWRKMKIHLKHWANSFKLKAKSEKILELKIEVSNFQYFENDKYLEYLDDMYVKLFATIDGVVSGDIKFKKWVLVDY